MRCEAGARCLAGCTVAECLHEARARGSRELFVLVVSIANLLEVVSYGMIRRRGKKEALLRVLL